MIDYIKLSFAIAFGIAVGQTIGSIIALNIHDWMHRNKN